MKKSTRIIFLFVLVGSGALIWWLTNLLTPTPVDFNTQIRPIINKNCAKCHGGVRQKGGLSLLFRDQALDTLESGLLAIVPGSPNSSALMHRIQEADPSLRMPPEGPALGLKEINLIKRWIKQGAPWDDHWAFVPPDPDIKLPFVNNSNYLNGIDNFVFRRLQQEGLQPAMPADKATLLRRVSLDLIGMPPPSEIAGYYLADTSAQAYERLVDQLMGSVHFGERWASLWLDLARYADSQGYQKDNLRPTMWMYRDWVIEAFNNDMPFDQFTIEQLAGDLLPDPQDDQLLATAFHRNTMSNDEGGTDDEEYRVAAVLDRVNTTFELWQGVTLGCVQCHSHPYDPIKHQEYYGAYAFFNNTQDSDKTNDDPNLPLLSNAQKNIKSGYAEEISTFKSRGDTVSLAYKEAISNFLSIQPLEVPIMKELATDSSRKSHIFERGNWLVLGDQVSPAVPVAINKFLNQSPSNRLELANWLVHPDNPLTARVMVNRVWEQLFGLGLVETLEDFGTQGAPPSHPELLDWLAGAFVNTHQWSIKGLLKQVVLSSTYRQSSRVSPALLELDPYNKLLARGPRVRLTAEQIRDQALMVSGLLNRRAYGHSVMPFQPEGVWNVIRHVDSWKTSTIPQDQHRRALYTFWRRVSPYPSMITFDATSREFCVSRRIRTNTPLQALVTLNDPVYFEAAFALALNMWHDGKSVEDQIAAGYNRALYRDPSPSEMLTMKILYEETLKNYQDKPHEIRQLIKAPELQSVELAAMINLATVILNLDEMITKG